LAPPDDRLTPEQARRYARQLSLPGLGAEGQRRLLDATVAVVGVGGLGCPAALYLAAAGVGRLVLVDGDRVDASNLHRQVLYGTADVGRPKVEVAAERLRALNPDVAVDARPVRLSAANARGILGPADLVLDGSDNFPTRFLVSDACVLLGKPNAHGSVFRFEGQASFFDARSGPCYRCLHPEPPPPGLVPSCAEAGVLGILPGVVGCLQATETVKYLLGIGEGLSGRIVVYDALSMGFRELRLRKDPACPSCGKAPTIRELADLEGYCEAGAVPAGAAAAGAAAGPGRETPPEVTAEELRDLLDSEDPPVLVDVREDWEAGMGMLPGAVHIPLGTIPGRWKEIPADREVVVYCHGGMRSMQAMQYLRSRGLERVASLEGGTEAWSTRVDPSLPRY
jgi:molybdopterin/thiamine biosynthesis adenylyltransferase/rhodanese-related sulfurtransferase